MSIFGVDYGTISGGGSAFNPTYLDSYVNPSQNTFTLTAEVGKTYALIGMNSTNADFSSITTTGCTITESHKGDSAGLYSYPYVIFFEATSTTVTIKFNNSAYSAMYYQMN